MSDIALTLLVMAAPFCLVGLLKIASSIIERAERQRAVLPYWHWCPALECRVGLDGCRDCATCILMPDGHF